MSEWVLCYQNQKDTSSTFNNRVVTTILSKWTRPQEGYVKCNYDCCYKQDGNPSGMAWILRDSKGFYLEAGHSIGTVCNSVLESELQALLMAMHHLGSRLS